MSMRTSFTGAPTPNNDRAHLGSSVAVVRGEGEGMVRVVSYT